MVSFQILEVDSFLHANNQLKHIVKNNPIQK